jgi:hypothetical protein
MLAMNGSSSYRFGKIGRALDPRGAYVAAKQFEKHRRRVAHPSVFQLGWGIRFDVPLIIKIVILNFHS